ncbi:NAD-binding protein [Gracilimonas sediminicola]|uniref:NAD-binding protein n=1 Tax=Gracilimonas sediminicola TaxID=2952158 RepID=UPI0038D3AD75
MNKLKKIVLVGAGSIAESVAEFLTHYDLNLIWVGPLHELSAEIEKNFSKRVFINISEITDLDFDKIANADLVIVAVANNFNKVLGVTMFMREHGMQNIISVANSKGEADVLMNVGAVGSFSPSPPYRSIEELL